MFLKDPRNKQLEVTKFILEWLFFYSWSKLSVTDVKKKQQPQNDSNSQYMYISELMKVKRRDSCNLKRDAK